MYFIIMAVNFPNLEMLSCLGFCATHCPGRTPPSCAAHLQLMSC